MKPKAIYYSMLKYQPESRRLLEGSFDLVELPNPSHDTAELLADVEVLFAPLGYLVDRAKIDACPKLRVVASNTTGHPHIDVDYCREKGIEVACLKFVPDFLQSITPTAELTMGLMIALTRNLVPAHEAALAGQWDRRPFGAPAMLSRMRIAVIGLGRLGLMVARYSRGFGMGVRYYDPYVESDEFERADSLVDVVKDADVVSLHVPHERETENMLDAGLIARFKPGAYLVNTSRGELVDWNALLDALKSGQVAGAALDVFEDEFNPEFPRRFPQHPFLQYAREHANVILTPHIGGSTVDAWRETEMKTIRMALAALAD